MKSCLNSVGKMSQKMNEGKKMQVFPQNCKFIGLRLYQIGISSEVLGCSLGVPKNFREKLGHAGHQDSKLQQWPLSAARGTGRMNNFLKASVDRRVATELKHAKQERKAPIVEELKDDTDEEEQASGAKSSSDSDSSSGKSSELFPVHQLPGDNKPQKRQEITSS